jgi:hypothetical protein
MKEPPNTGNFPLTSIPIMLYQLQYIQNLQVDLQQFVIVVLIKTW